VTGVRPGCSAAFSVDVDGDEQLVMVSEVDPQHAADAEAVISAIRQTISEQHELQTYAVALVKPGSVPKTSSGKIQRRACKDAFVHERLDAIRVWRGRGDPVVQDAPVDPSAALEVPPTPFESEVATLVASRLNLARGSIDIHKPLSSYGIDSLGAVELAEALQTAFGVELPMQDLLSGPSIRDLARMLGERKATAPAPAPALADRNEHALSYGQRALWLVQQLAPESTAYNVSIAVRIQGGVDLHALRHT
jgi:acyl carrier protein